MTRFFLALYFIGALGGAFWGAGARADEFFENTRHDPSMPPNCAEFDMRDFATVSRIILAGPQGARREGFTHEYPIAREDAATLWQALNTSGAVVPEVIRSNPRLSRDYALLTQLGPRMGFDYGKEGDVLEALALHLLRQEFPEREYFLTGGVAYSPSATLAALGELDIIVGRRSDCAVVAIGEAKLGVRQRNHALAQLKRFTDFAKSKLCRTDARQLICSMR